ncbi:hypothetical protein [Streptomyces sp. NPDC058665]|uniref:hypothetical protein n=1 Tax=Streptomyces sp. NPDC058665 TaxID=3346586 RepID=UPI00364A1E65
MGPTGRVSAAFAAAATEARTGIEQAIARMWQEFLQITDPADLAADPVTARITEAFSAFEIAQQEAGEYERYALSRLRQSVEAEVEAQRAYDTEKGRRQHRWYPDGPIAIAAAEEAATAVIVR